MPTSAEFPHARRKGGDFLSDLLKKYYLCLAWGKAPYIESESKLTTKLVKNMIISMVYGAFRSYQI